MAVLPTQFPVFWANNSHNSSKVASGLPLFLSTLPWNYLNDCISVSPWVAAVNSPLFFVA